MPLHIPRTVIRYISGEFLKTFGFTLGVITAIWVLGIAILTVRHEVLGPKAFLAAVPLMAVISLKYTLPMAVLFGAAISYGRMSAENEIRAMEWHGIHIGWIIFPAAVVAVAASLLALALDCELIPAAERHLSRTVRSNVMDIMDRQLNRAAQAKTPIALGNYTINLTSYDSSNRTIKGITVFQTDKLRRPMLRIDAPLAEIVPGKDPDALAVLLDEDEPSRRRRFVTFRFQGGIVTRFDPESTKITGYCAAFPVALDLSSQRGKDVGIKGLSSLRLAAFSREAERPRDRLEARSDLYERCAWGISPLFFVLLAAPMASLIKWKHNLTAFLPSLAVVMLVYYPLLMWAKAWSEAGRIEPFWLFAAHAALLLVSAAVIFVLVRR